MAVTKLRMKQKRWIEEYKKTGNATQAAKNAGYVAKNDNVYAVIGNENLIKLKDYIQEYEEKLDKEKVISVEEVLQFWSDVIKDDNNSMPDRIKASELRMKAAGGFIDRSKVELSGNVPVTIVDDLNED